MKKQIFLVVLLILSKISSAQITDPMITRWWFNTTGNTYNGIVTDVDVVYYTTQYVYVHSSGIPNYYLDGQSVNNGSDLDATWQIPRIPTAGSATAGPMGGQTGLMLDGSVFFTPGDARSYQNAGAWNQLAYYFEGVDMDSSNGHSTPTNMYHHHFDNLKLHGWDSTQHSPLVGFAWDGYPLYGPFGYVNTNGTGGIKRMQSSYVKKTYTTRTNGPNVGGMYPIGCYIEDWQYTSGYGELDEHNGRFCVTPEYPAGTYAYFTAVDSTFSPYYPYFIGPTFYGLVSNTNLGPNGGNATVPGAAMLYNPLATSLNDIDQINSKIEIYPTPVTTDLSIRLKEKSVYKLNLYNLKGELILSKTIADSEKLSMVQLSRGVYFIELTDQSNNSGFIKRIVKM